MAPYTSHVIRPTVNKDIRQDDKPNQPCFLFFCLFRRQFFIQVFQENRYCIVLIFFYLPLNYGH